MQSNFSIDNSIIVKYENWFTKIFGNKQFIKSLFRIFVPAALQSLISIIVIYVDNFSLAILIDDPIKATAAKDALGLANPSINLQISITIGWLSGTGIMMSQYLGNQDYKSTRRLAFFRIWSSILIQIPMIIATMVFPGKIITLVSNTHNGYAFEYAKIYLFYTAITFFPYVIASSLSFSLQETKRPLFSFIAALIGMITNIILDPIVITTTDNIETAIMLVALSTGIARIVQLIIILMYIQIKKDVYLLFWKEWIIPIQQLKHVLKSGIIVFLNETLFAFMNSILMICLLNFNPTIHTATTNVVLLIEFTIIVWPGFGAVSSILIGSTLGAGNIQLAKSNANKLLSWALIFSLTLCILVFIFSLFINPVLSPAASNYMNMLSMHMEWIYIPIIASQGVFSIIYYSLRAGGSKLVFFSDSFIMIIFTIIIVAITFTGNARHINPLLFLFFVKSEEMVKMVISIFFYKYSNWARVLTNKEISKVDRIQYEIGEL